MDIFTQSTERKIPKTLEECRKADPICKELRQNSEKVNKNGILIWFAFSLFGLLLGLILGSDADSFSLGLIIFLIGFSIGSSIYGIYRVIALFIIAKASSVQSLKITSDILMYNTACDSKFEAKDIINKYEDSIKASNTVLSDKRMSELARKADKEKETDTRWECPACFTKNPQSSLYCNDCGRHK